MQMKAACAQSLDLALPVEQVYGFVADLNRWPLWLEFVVSVHQDGQELCLCLRSGKRRWQERFEVTRLITNAFISLEGALSAARRIDFRFEQRRSGTRLHLQVGYPVYGGLLGKIRDAVWLRGRVSRDIVRSLAHLKDTLEPQAAAEELDEAFANTSVVA